MANPCKTCSHAQVDEINAGIVGGVTLADLSKRYGVDTKALGRHKAGHLAPSLIRVAQEERAAAPGRSLLARIERLISEAEDVMAVAKADGKASLSLQAIRELRGLLETYGKATGEIRPDGVQVNVVNLQTSADWLHLRGRILGALAPYPDARSAFIEAIATDAPSRPQIAAPAAITPYSDERPLGDPDGLVGDDHE